MAYTQNAGRGPMQKTGRGIPENLKSPAGQAQTYEQTIASLQKRIAAKDEQDIKDDLQKNQAQVIDSMGMVAAGDRAGAAEKYGNYARSRNNANIKSDEIGKRKDKELFRGGKQFGTGLAKDASEDPWETENLQGSRNKNPFLQKKSYEETIAGLQDQINLGDLNDEEDRLKGRQQQVIDSLEMVANGARYSAAEKYGNASRQRASKDFKKDTFFGKGLPLNASESSQTTSDFQRRSEGRKVPFNR
jgi:hypothetical protein|tara:strand:- start:58 stop:795 length:738 start_codon:yes stop_codon:yes gene_type:complete